MLVLAALMAGAPASLLADKTDKLYMSNGDVVTCEIKRMAKGKLSCSTDDIGTLDVEWDKVDSLASTNVFEVRTQDGSDVYGRLATTGKPRQIGIVGITMVIVLNTDDVVQIERINSKFWSRIDGSADFGFSFTKSSDLFQINLAANPKYRTRQRSLGMDVSSLVTWQNGERTTRKQSLSFTFERSMRKLWFTDATLGFEQNDELGLSLRTNVAAASGRYLARTNHHEWVAAGGLSFAHEQPTSGEAQESLEALAVMSYGIFRYDKPKTDLSTSVQVYPSLTIGGRVRLEFQLRLNQDIYEDFYVSLRPFASGDNKPPSGGATAFDYGVTLNLGVTY